MNQLQDQLTRFFTDVKTSLKESGLKGSDAHCVIKLNANTFGMLAAPQDYPPFSFELSLSVEPAEESEPKTGAERIWNEN